MYTNLLNCWMNQCKGGGEVVRPCDRRWYLICSTGPYVHEGGDAFQ
jgi:hypothetical protein